MGRPEKSLDRSGGAVAAFAHDLRKLRTDAGSPAYREMARSALFSSSVLSSAASGHRLPTLQVTLAFVTVCGGDPQSWERRWRTLSGTFSPPAGPARKAKSESSTQSPAQLPVRPHGFTGRAVELASLELHSMRSRLPVVISGPVGVGKTDLALRYAHTLTAVTPDGQLYADFDASPEVSGRDVLKGFLKALVAADQVPADPGQQAGLYRSLLARRRLVVLLDNVRDEQQARPLLAETSHGALIMVSRTSLLGLSEVRRVELDVLGRGDSIAMIEALVGERATQDRAACDRLAEACGDLPLALDVAARRLASRPDWVLRDAVARCVKSGALLDWLRIGDISVRDRLASAYRMLTLPARNVLEQLVRGAACEVDTSAVARALGLTLWGVEELLEELVGAGMLRRGAVPGGYRLDRLIHSFAVDQAVVPVRGARIPVVDGVDAHLSSQAADRNRFHVS